MQAKKRAEKMDFGVEVRVFCALHDITIKSLAIEAGIPYDTLLSTMTGRRSGKAVKPKIRKLMKEIDKR